MSRSPLHAPRYDALRAIVTERRKRLGFTQAELAKKIGRYQSYIADFERGERRIDVLDFIELAEGLGLDLAKTIKAIAATKRT